MPKGSYGPAELIWTAAKKCYQWSWMVPPWCSQYLCMGPLLLTKNTTNGNEWACCSSWDAAKALIWAHCCCSKFCWWSQMVPAVFSEMLPVYSYGPINAGKKYHWWHEWAHCYSWDAAEALIWAHRCCWKNLPMVTKRHTTSPERCCVKAPPMVGSTWTRVRFILISDCLPALFQGTILPLPLSLSLCFLWCLHAHVWCLMSVILGLY